jgi:hypothetical protein
MLQFFHLIPIKTFQKCFQIKLFHFISSRFFVSMSFCLYCCPFGLFSTFFCLYFSSFLCFFTLFCLHIPFFVHLSISLPSLFVYIVFPLSLLKVFLFFFSYFLFNHFCISYSRPISALMQLSIEAEQDKIVCHLSLKSEIL